MSSVFKMTYMWNIIWGAFNNFEEKSSKIYKNLSILLQLQITQTLCSANFKEIDAFLKILEHFSSKLCTCQYFAPGGSVWRGWGFWKGNVALGWGFWSQLHVPGRGFWFIRTVLINSLCPKVGILIHISCPRVGILTKFFFVFLMFMVRFVRACSSNEMEWLSLYARTHLYMKWSCATNGKEWFF